MSPRDRATAARAMAEAAQHPRDRAAWRAAAALWERIAGPGDTLSLEPAARQLAALKRDVALATGPFQRPAPKAAPVPDAPMMSGRAAQPQNLPRPEVIEF